MKHPAGANKAGSATRGQEMAGMHQEIQHDNQPVQSRGKCKEDALADKRWQHGKSHRLWAMVAVEYDRQRHLQTILVGDR